MPLHLPPSTSAPQSGRSRRSSVLAGVVVALALVAVACGSGSTGTTTGGGPGGGRRIEVVAAENFWGSIAAQLGGAHVEVASIISNPDTDPHDYEPSAADGRTVAEAGYVIENGLGYDPWAAQLVAANQTAGQKVLDVGHLLGLKVGDNPHRWYFPGDVEQVIDRITADYQRHRPGRRRVLRPEAGRLRAHGAGGVPRAHRPDQDALRRHPGRCIREHLRGAGAGHRPQAADAAVATSTPSARAPIPPRPTRRPSTTRSRATRSTSSC